MEGGAIRASVAVDRRLLEKTAVDFLRMKEAGAMEGEMKRLSRLELERAGLVRLIVCKHLLCLIPKQARLKVMK